jgi:hypothetical protein
MYRMDMIRLVQSLLAEGLSHPEVARRLQADGHRIERQTVDKIARGRHPLLEGGSRYFEEAEPLRHNGRPKRGTCGLLVHCPCVAARTEGFCPNPDCPCK